MPTPYADLEIRLRPHHSGGYAVGLRFSRSDSETLDETESELPVAFDLEALRAAEHDPAGYGQALTDSLFADPLVREKFAAAGMVAHDLGAPLRVRLFVHRGAPTLDALRWETLRHPGEGTPLASSERVLFSRFLSNDDWRSVRRVPRGELKALVAVASPTKDVGAGPGQWPLAPIDVAGELDRAKAALGPDLTATIPSPVTLDALTAHIRQQEPDILYLACHGGRRQGDGEPIVYLETENHAVAVVSAADLAEQLDLLEQRLRLVVLASCRSSGADVIAADGGALAALGPRLAEAGAPAVVAMQGDVSMTTIEQFMPVFFRELREHGQIDRAMARARNLVRERPDAWMPVLFLRLKSGLWYEPGFAGDLAGFEQWPALLNAIKRGNCVPILGSGLTDGVFGTRREIARRWAEANHFPLAPHEREDLPQVAQYLTVRHDQVFAIDTLVEQVKDGLLRRYRGEPPDGLSGETVSAISSVVGKQQRQERATEPHRVLAGLPLSVYVTTNQDNLLADALRDAGKAPRVELFRWSADPLIEWPPSIYDPASAVYQPAYQPSSQQPLVYHLFGNLDYPDTLVLTEDHYFDYLMRSSLPQTREIAAEPDPANIPSAVLKALARDALLFVGFQMDDWDFRVLLRSIIRREGSRTRRYANVGVQVSPEEGRFLEAEAARDYLDRYFAPDKISIFWGNAEVFAAELARQLAQPGRNGGS